MDEYMGIIDLLRDRYYDSDQAIRDSIRSRRLPKPIKIGGKLRWKRSVIEAWFANETICWIERTNKR